MFHSSTHTLAGAIVKKFFSFFVLTAFILSSIISPSYAQVVFNLPQPGQMVALSESFVPAVLKGVSIHPENPLVFDFIVDNGHTKLAGQALTDETTKLAKYFLAGIAVPEKELWVNLSPNENDRVMADNLSQTDVGRELLAQDYLLKQITASLLYPEKDLGRKFWEEVYARANAQFGTTDIPVDTFNKVWITPSEATVYQHGNNAFVAGSHLKVMLESDYAAAMNAGDPTGRPYNNDAIDRMGERRGDPLGRPDMGINPSQEMAKSVVREIILPVLEKEVNEGKNFAALRQVFQSLILAGWYKNALKSAFLNQVYANSNKVEGITIPEKDAKEKVYAQYMEAYRKGVFNYIKDDAVRARHGVPALDALPSDVATDTKATQVADQLSHQGEPRHYFSGGIMADFAMNPLVKTDFAAANDVKTEGVVQVIQMQMQEVAQIGASEKTGWPKDLKTYAYLFGGDFSKWEPYAEELRSLIYIVGYLNGPKDDVLSDYLNYFTTGNKEGRSITVNRIQELSSYLGTSAFYSAFVSEARLHFTSADGVERWNRNQELRDVIAKINPDAVSKLEAIVDLVFVSQEAFKTLVVLDYAWNLNNEFMVSGKDAYHRAILEALPVLRSDVLSSSSTINRTHYSAFFENIKGLIQNHAIEKAQGDLAQKILDEKLSALETTDRAQVLVDRTKEIAQGKIVAGKLLEILDPNSPSAKDFLKDGFGQLGSGVAGGAAILGSFATGDMGDQGYYVDQTNKRDMEGNPVSGKQFFLNTVDSMQAWMKARNPKIVIKFGIGGQHTPFEAIAQPFEKRFSSGTIVTGVYELERDHEAYLNELVKKTGARWDEIAFIPSSKSGTTDETMLLFVQYLKIVMKNLANARGLDGQLMAEGVFQYLHDINFSAQGQELENNQLFVNFNFPELAKRLGINEDIVKDLFKTVLSNTFFESVNRPDKSRLAAFISNSKLDATLGKEVANFGEMFDNVGGRWTGDLHMMTFLAKYGLDADAYWQARYEGIKQVVDGTHRANAIAGRILDENIKKIALVVPDEFFWFGKSDEQNSNESIWQNGFMNLRAIPVSQWRNQAANYQADPQALVWNLSDMDMRADGFKVENMPIGQVNDRQALALKFADLFTTFYGVTFQVGTQLIARALNEAGYTAADVNISDLTNPATQVVMNNLFTRQPFVELGKGFLSAIFVKLQEEQNAWKQNPVGESPLDAFKNKIVGQAQEGHFLSTISADFNAAASYGDMTNLFSAAIKKALAEKKTFVPLLYLGGNEFVDLRLKLMEAGYPWIMQGTGDQHISLQQVLAHPEAFVLGIVSFVPKAEEMLPASPAIGFAKGYLDHVSPSLVNDAFALATYLAFTEKRGGEAFFLQALKDEQRISAVTGAFVASAELIKKNNEERMAWAMPQTQSRDAAQNLEKVLKAGFVGEAATYGDMVVRNLTQGYQVSMQFDVKDNNTSVELLDPFKEPVSWTVIEGRDARDQWGLSLDYLERELNHENPTLFDAAQGVGHVWKSILDKEITRKSEDGAIADLGNGDYQIQLRYNGLNTTVILAATLNGTGIVFAKAKGDILGDFDQAKKLLRVQIDNKQYTPAELLEFLKPKINTRAIKDREGRIELPLIGGLHTVVVSFNQENHETTIELKMSGDLSKPALYTMAISDYILNYEKPSIKIMLENQIKSDAAQGNGVIDVEAFVAANWKNTGSQIKAGTALYIQKGKGKKAAYAVGINGTPIGILKTADEQMARIFLKALSNEEDVQSFQGAFSMGGLTNAVLWLRNRMKTIDFAMGQDTVKNKLKVSLFSGSEALTFIADAKYASVDAAKDLFMRFVQQENRFFYGFGIGNKLLVAVDTSNLVQAKEILKALSYDADFLAFISRNKENTKALAQEFKAKLEAMDSAMVTMENINLYNEWFESVVNDYKLSDVLTTARKMMAFSDALNSVSSDKMASDVRMAYNNLLVNKSNFSRRVASEWTKTVAKKSLGYAEFISILMPEAFGYIEHFGDQMVAAKKSKQSSMDDNIAMTKKLLPEWLDANNNVPRFIIAGIIRGILEGRSEDILYAFGKDWRMFGTAGIRNQAVQSSFGVIADLELEEFSKAPDAEILTGPNLMNVMTIIQQEKAIANVYQEIQAANKNGTLQDLIKESKLEPGFVNDIIRNNKVSIAYDSRLNGKFFAHMIAAGLLEEGIDVDLFDRPSGVPTVIYQAAENPDTRSGIWILISASHSEANYNGFKAGLAAFRSQVDVNGKNMIVGQRESIVGSPKKNISVVPYQMASEMGEMTMKDFDDIFKSHARLATTQGRLRWISDTQFNPDTNQNGADADHDFFKRYYDHVQELSPAVLLGLTPEEQAKFIEAKTKMNIFYTAFSGGGSVNAQDFPGFLARMGYSQITTNKNQTDQHDGRFAGFNRPGGKFGMPDPGVVQGWLVNFFEFMQQHAGDTLDEAKLKDVIELINAFLVGLATDPDIDRTGIMLALTDGLKGGNIKAPLIDLVKEKLTALGVSSDHLARVEKLLTENLRDAQLLTANDAWAFIAFHKVRMMIERNKMSKDKLYIIEKSHVTTDALESVAAHFRSQGYQIYTVDTYVGFTELAKKSRDLFNIARASWLIHQHLSEIAENPSTMGSRQSALQDLYAQLQLLNTELKRNVMYQSRGVPFIDSAIKKLGDFLNLKIGNVRDLMQDLNTTAHMEILMGVEESNGYGEFGSFTPNENLSPAVDETRWSTDIVGRVEKEHISEKDGSLAAFEFAELLALGQSLEGKTPFQMYLDVFKAIGAVGTDNRFISYVGLTGEEKKLGAMQWLEQTLTVLLQQAIDQGKDVTLFNGKYRLKDVSVYRDAKYDVFWVGFPEEGVRLTLERVADGSTVSATFRPSGTGASNRVYSWAFGALQYKGKKVSSMNEQELNEYRIGIVDTLNELAKDFFGIQDEVTGYASLGKANFHGLLSALGEITLEQYDGLLAKFVDDPLLAQGFLSDSEKFLRAHVETYGKKLGKFTHTKTGVVDTKAEGFSDLRQANSNAWRQFLSSGIRDTYPQDKRVTLVVNGYEITSVPQAYARGWQTSLVDYLADRLSLELIEPRWVGEDLQVSSNDPEIIDLLKRRYGDSLGAKIRWVDAAQVNKIDNGATSYGGIDLGNGDYLKIISKDEAGMPKFDPAQIKQFKADLKGFVPVPVGVPQPVNLRPLLGLAPTSDQSIRLSRRDEALPRLFAVRREDAMNQEALV